MKKYFSIIYWIAATIILSAILVSILKTYSASLLLSIMILPGALFAKYFMKDISFKNRKSGIINSLYLALATLFIVYLGIFFSYWFLLKLEPRDCPDIISNPIFIWLLLISFIGLEKFIVYKLFTTEYKEKYIEFISERKKISIEIDSIKYIESKDDEVWIRTISDISYRTRMKISQWEEVLDNRFLRVHRSFIINKNLICQYNSSLIVIGDKSFEISRKYKEKVLDELSMTQSAIPNSNVHNI